MQLVFAPVWGRLSDQIGRRPVLLVSLAGSAVSYLLLASALATLGPRVPEVFAAALCFVNVGLAARRLPESRPADRSSPASFRHPLSPDSVREALAPPGAARLIGVL